MPLFPGATIGIIGGGQLGRMLAMAAARLGFRTCILEPGEDCPAAQVANRHLNFAYDDQQGLQQLGDLCDVITYEFENVPVDAARNIEAHSILCPPSRALEMSQDRLVEKEFLIRCGAKTARFADIKNPADLEQALNDFGGQGILKTRRLGYDGKGQVFLGGNDAANQQALKQIANAPSILEEMIPFEREISLIIARGKNGTTTAYDPAENIHREGILRTSTVPAKIVPQTAKTAYAIARSIADNLDYVGVMGVEFFVMQDETLLVNEIAPRVHNSGHWTEAACTISQFEQHIRAIAGWPLGVTQRHSNCVMENIIGNDVEDLGSRSSDAMELLHLYGKSEVRDGRKMGHVTRLAPLDS